MKASIERLALKLAMIGLAVVAMAAPARARLSVRNGESASKALITASSLCPSNFPCTASDVTSLVGIRGTTISKRR